MYYIGIDVGGMSLKAGISKGDCNILDKETCPTRVSDGYYAIVDDLVGLVNTLTKRLNISLSEVKGVGLGIPGTVNKGVVTDATNLNWKDRPLVLDLEKRLNVPVFIDNDANCAALAEYKFGDVKAENIVHVTLGTGVGTGIIIEGRMLWGFNGFGGEGGHMVIMKDGVKCGCGRKGCWEAYASTTALLRSTLEAIEQYPNSILARGGKNIDGFTLFNAVNNNCPIAKKVLEKYISDVACGLANLCNIFSPEVVLIGGGVSAEEELLVKPLEKAVNDEIYGSDQNNVRIPVRRAKFGNKSGIVGALSLAISGK